jgi:hypothetical protein
MFGFYKQAFYEQQYIVSSMTEREGILLKSLEEANQKLINFMDLTRKEALDIYRKGLQDGINMQLKNIVPEAPVAPVRTMEEHAKFEAEAKESKKVNDLIAEGIANMLNFDGTPQKRGEE